MASGEQIRNVRATPVPMGRDGAGAAVALPGVALVSWESDAADSYVQAYVNGVWAGETLRPGQRSLLVSFDARRPALIELAAAAAAERGRNQATKLSGFDGGEAGQVTLTWPRRGSLAADWQAEVFTDDGAGAIDYGGEPWARMAVWGRDEKWGWGGDAFGYGDFGYSGTGAPGWGQGGWGAGEFGFDAVMMGAAWGAEAPGVYRFGLRFVNGQGQAGAATETTAALDPVPKAPRLELERYEAAGNKVVLRIC